MATELEIAQGMLDVARSAEGYARIDMTQDEKLGRDMLADAQARTQILRESFAATRGWQTQMLAAAQAQAAAINRQAAAIEASDPTGPTPRRHYAAWLLAEAIGKLGSAKAAGTLVEEYLAELDRIAPEA